MPELSSDDIRLLREIQQWYRANRYTAQLPQQPMRRSSSSIQNREVLLVRAPVGGIPARSGIDAGVESCSIMQKNADDEIVDTGNVIDVYSWAAFSACANGSRLGLAHRDKYGTYWIGSEDCEDVTDSF